MSRHPFGMGLAPGACAAVGMTITTDLTSLSLCGDGLVVAMKWLTSGRRTTSTDHGKPVALPFRRRLSVDGGGSPRNLPKAGIAMTSVPAGWLVFVPEKSAARGDLISANAAWNATINAGAAGQPVGLNAQARPVRERNLKMQPLLPVNEDPATRPQRD